jgi:predicted transcriptional regulator
MHIEIDEAHAKLDEIHEKIESDNFKSALFSIKKFIDIMSTMENTIKLKMKNKKLGEYTEEEEEEI